MTGRLATRTLAGLLDIAAARWPEAEAVVGLERRLTWAEVRHEADAIARGLVADGVLPADRVAIAMLKDAESLVAFHAIMRAGAIAVPVDPLAPRDVAVATLTDAEVTGIVGDARTLALIEPEAIDGVRIGSIICTDGDANGGRSWEALVAEAPAETLPEPAPTDPAYIIYTSGSTGHPKGIVHTHASGLAYAERAAEAHGLSETDRVAGIPPLHFDQATFELFAAPLAGAAVIVMGEGHSRFPAALVERTEAERITVWYTVPSLLRQLAERGGMDQRDLGSLRLVKYGGEVYPAGALNQLHALLPQARVTNVYGPAEVNECTNHTVDLPLDADADTPIGRPWAGVAVRIVDDAGIDAPPGRAGELLVSGPTTMQGYWRRPEPTGGAVSTDEAGRRWYATGDLVTADVDGVLWFHGRRDNQVKVRGVRIELEAVEAVVADAPGVAEAVVGPTPDGTALEAVIIDALGEAVSDGELRRWCSRRLAQAAIPRAFHRVERFPTTPSGKVDRAVVRAGLAQERP